MRNGTGMGRAGTLLAAILALGTAASADIISGKVLDLDAGTPLAGVKVTASGVTATATSAADGSFTFNTGTSGVLLPGARDGRSGIAWDGAAFRWDGGHGAVRVEVRTLRGDLVDAHDAGATATPFAYPYAPASRGVLVARFSGDRGVFRFRLLDLDGRVTVAPLDPAPAGGAALAKAAAANVLIFTKLGYATDTVEVEGSRTGLEAKLKKTGEVRKAVLTWFESYPDPGSEECIKYNGCTWAGYFAGVSGKQPESWVKANNIAAVHSKDFPKYKLKTLRLQQGTKTIDVKVYDMCSDSDCDGCCTRNAGSTGFLIDLEKYTRDRFGAGSGIVDWTCLDCAP